MSAVEQIISVETRKADERFHDQMLGELQRDAAELRRKLNNRLESAYREYVRDIELLVETAARRAAMSTTLDMSRRFDDLLRQEHVIVTLKMRGDA